MPKPPPAPDDRDDLPDDASLFREAVGPVRGVRTELTINPEGYVGEGDLFLFASVLNEFFALYASLNSYHELRVQSTQGEVYQWTPRMGQQPLL